MASKKTKKTKEAEDLTFGFEFDGINSFDAGFEDWTPYQPIGARYARTD